MLKTYFRRLWAYIRGQQMEAENIADAPAFDDFVWSEEARADPDLAEYALEASRRSADAAGAAVASLQSKAGSLLTVLLTLMPLAFVGTGFALSSTAGPRWSRLVAFILMVLTDLALVVAAVLAFVASGMLLSGGLNMDRMPWEGSSTLPGLQTSEANAWHLAAQLGMWQGPRVSMDLFHARRMVVIALVLATTATPFIVIARSGDQVFTGEVPAHISPSPSGPSRP